MTPDFAAPLVMEWAMAVILCAVAVMVVAAVIWGCRQLYKEW